MTRMTYLRCFRALNRARVPYLVAGGIALTPIGMQRLNADIEIMASRGAPGLARLLAAVERLRPQMATDPTVELVLIEAAAFADQYSRRVLRKVGRLTIPVAAIDERDPEADYRYEQTDGRIRRGLSMTPAQRLTWLEDARRFVLLMRHADRARGPDSSHQ